MKSDHTRIDIEFDPQEQRMKGTTIHGNVSFDVPFISKITDNLWQGGCRDGLILPDHIDHVVSLYPWESYEQRDGTSYQSFLMYDSEDVDYETAFDAAKAVNSLRADGVVLVHCQAGLNRSGLVAGLALILDGMNPQDAIVLLRKSRSPAVLCNPAFEQVLLDC